MSSDDSDMDIMLSQFMREKNKKKKAPAQPKGSSLPPLAAEVSEPKNRKARGRPRKSETTLVPPSSQIQTPSTRKKRKTSEANLGTEASEPARLTCSEAVHSLSLSSVAEGPSTCALLRIEVSEGKKRKFPAQAKSLEGEQSQSLHLTLLHHQPVLPVRSRSSEATQSPTSPPTSQGPSEDALPEVEVSEFDSSVENHFKAVDTIVKLCGQPDLLDSDNEEIQRFSNSVTFLIEWRDFKYPPRVVKFACQHSLKKSDVIDEITLSQFSSAAFPKRGMHTGSNISGTESKEDFVMNVGGAVWALDWCPKEDRNSENHIQCEFVAVSAHPPESSYHKIGAPLTGRGAIQVWCLLTVHEDNSTNKVPLRPRGRPRKPSGNPNNKLIGPVRPRKPGGNPKKNKPPRPRKKPLGNFMEEMDSPLDIEPICVYDSDCSLHTEDNERTREDSDENVAEESESTYADAKTSGNLIPRDVALPRMILCLAHNGKVAWDVKWRPLHASFPGTMSKMGHLAVLLGSGALEVWEVPLPHTVMLIYPAFQPYIDPRFIKLQPIFKCSVLKFGGRQSIPLTMEWSLSPPHDMILVGCHDGTVALWKFSITGPSTDSRPLLFFNADTGPIRSIAWTPPQSDLGSENIIVTAGYKGFKFWDIRDPFRPLWAHYIKGVSYSVDWLHDPRCVLGCTDDGTLWLISLLKAISNEIPVAGRPSKSKPGILHTFYCSSFSIWSAQASQLTGMIAYCGEDGNTFCFKPTAKLILDPRKRNEVEHHLFGSVLEEDTAIVVASPLPDSPFSRTIPSMTRGPKTKDQEEIIEEHTANVDESDPVHEIGYDMTKEESPCSKSNLKHGGAQKSKGEVKPKFDVFPPKSVAMHSSMECEQRQ